MALKVVHRNDDVRVHHGVADLGLPDKLPLGDGDQGFVGAFKSVGDDDLAAGGGGAEAVEHGHIQVIDGIFPAPHVQGVAVGEEGDAPLLPDQVGHHLDIVGAQVGQVALLPEVDL